MQEITTSSIFHYHQHMFATLEYFKQSNNIRVFNLLKQVDFLKDFPFAEIVLHVRFLNGLNSHVFASQLMNTEGDLTKGPLPNQFHEFVVFEGGRRQLIMLLNVGLYELYQPVSFLKNGVIYFGSSISIAVFVLYARMVELRDLVLRHVHIVDRGGPARPVGAWSLLRL